MNKQPEHFRYFLGATKIKLLAVTEIRERYVPSKKHMQLKKQKIQDLQTRFFLKLM